MSSSQKKPALSIIIISKNEQKVLPRLLKSIRSQSFKDYEIILSDAFSTDRTRAIAKRFGCRIVDGGLPSKGRNNGAKAALADMLLFLDSDVVLPPRFLEANLLEFMSKDLSVATPKYEPMSDKTIDKLLHMAYNAWARSMQYIYPHSAGFCIFSRKKIFEQLNGFDEALFIAEDHDYVNRAGKIGIFRLLSASPILVDVRRLDKEGRFNLVKKYLKFEWQRLKNGKAEGDYKLHG